MIRPAIAAEITDFASAKAWIEGLVKADLDFHFDDDPETIFNIRTDQRTFTDEEVPVIRERLDALYSYEWGEYECPIGYVLHVGDYLNEGEATA